MSLFDEIAAAILRFFDKRFDQLDERLGGIEKLLQSIKRKEDTQMATLADIRAKVEQSRTVQDSAIVLLEQLSQLLRDAIASGDPAALQEIADTLDSERQEMADALTANTPAENP